MRADEAITDSRDAACACGEAFGKPGASAAPGCGAACGVPDWVAPG